MKLLEIRNTGVPCSSVKFLLVFLDLPKLENVKVPRFETFTPFSAFNRLEIYLPC